MGEQITGLSAPLAGTIFVWKSPRQCYRLTNGAWVRLSWFDAVARWCWMRLRQFRPRVDSVDTEDASGGRPL